MPDFVKDPRTTTPFGRNEFLRSTHDVKTESYTLSAASVPSAEIDGSTQKVFQPGTALRKITSGAEAGKVGPAQAGVVDGRELPANDVGIALTFVPWQLLERDVEVGVVVQATVVQAWCFEYDAAGNRIALTNATADGMYAQKRLQINFA